jgi:glycosyltransferase involved in cell wall biosynthesis
VLIVTTSFPGGGQPPGSEAAGTFVEEFGIALAGKVPVAVVAPSLLDRDDRAQERLPVFRYRVPSLPLSTLRPLNPLHMARILRVLQSGTKAVMGAVRAREPEHILAMWALPSGYWAMKAGSEAGCSYSTWSLGSDIWSLSRVPLVSGVLGNVLRRASCRFADGIALCREVEALSGCGCSFLPSSRSIGSTAGAGRDAPPYRLSFLGRWHPNKGVDLLLDALELLDSSAWECISAVRIHGGGPLDARVRAGVSSLSGAGRHVGCGGYLDRESAAGLYADSDFILIPSRIESIPLVFSDAVQCGLPVICTPVGDLPELVARFGCGTVAATVSPGGLAEAIASSVTAPRSVLVRGTVAAAREFSPDSAADSFLHAAGLGPKVDGPG